MAASGFVSHTVIGLFAPILSLLCTAQSCTPRAPLPTYSQVGSANVDTPGRLAGGKEEQRVFLLVLHYPWWCLSKKEPQGLLSSYDPALQRQMDKSNRKVT